MTPGTFYADASSSQEPSGRFCLQQSDRPIKSPSEMNYISIQIQCSSGNEKNQVCRDKTMHGDAQNSSTLL